MDDGSLGLLLRTEAEPTGDHICRLLDDHVRPAGRTETDNIDFKREFDGSKRAWLGLLKDIVSMAHAKGGVIVFGIANDGAAPGLTESLADTLDSARVRQQAHGYGAAFPIITTYQETTWNGVLAGVLRVRSLDGIFVFDKDGEYATGSGPPKKVFRAGEVYVRVCSENKTASYADLCAIMQRTVDAQVAIMVSRVERVMGLPLDAELMVRHPQSRNAAYLLGDSNAIRTVAITEDPDAVEVALADTTDPSRPYQSIQAEVAAQIRLGRGSGTQHRAPRRLLSRWYIGRAGLDVTPEIAEFCFLSACYDYGYPMFWARHIPRERLVQLVEEETRRSAHPMPLVLPYVVATFLWDDRRRYLDPLKRSPLALARRSADRLSSLSEREPFLYSGRLRAATFRWEGKRMPFKRAVQMRSSAQDLYDELLRLDITSSMDSTHKSVAYQLDILLHAPDPVWSEGLKPRRDRG